jgi:hypothetical protein
VLSCRDESECGRANLATGWDHPHRRCRVSTTRGERTCDVLITATGVLSELKIPKVPELETFRRKVFHSTRWDAGYDLRDWRVAVVGTGASAVQFVDPGDGRLPRPVSAHCGVGLAARRIRDAEQCGPRVGAPAGASTRTVRAPPCGRRSAGGSAAPPAGSSQLNHRVFENATITACGCSSR